MNCKEGAQHIAGQIVSLVSEIERQDYARPLEVFNGSTLGQHFRHILEFYRCLIQGAGSGLIDYANRQRDPDIENDPHFARRACQELVTAIAHLEEDQRIAVKADFSANGENERPIVQSSIGRELMFAYDHAVHHLAIIKIGLQTGFPKLRLDPNLGVAPSTVKFRQEQRHSADG